ncbi:N-acetyltransferase 10 [Angomonas deanei]|uniref:RNA cytidine acetyltransferase n=1 Tax=Angomonas deanei TaxID=59799 RepID=A0A7G2CTQ9_9TRYP|nr:N-acetyltransferase 10 [Angomonas deanei]CAD2221622.1 Domain of unknown function (DUF1726)/Helicase/GNAT acetyltransferase 2/Possible tRNA binding domain containing protein, putative [Angomonas deanei]|eukprot:EPY24323.1 N-acetyltransferase 10 [Angomonas deanei]
MSTEATKDSFQTFLAQTEIRFCKYNETHKILGQTFGMAILQDFEAIDPNTLARTMETVKGGGLIVIMFRAMRSLKQLYTITMDVHARYRTEALQDVVPRFNERFLLSLSDCTTALCVDDDLTVLPITTAMKNYGKNRNKGSFEAELTIKGELKHEAELSGVKEKLRQSTAVGPLVQLCQTLDQAKTVLSLMQSVTEKTLDSTCVVTAGRGRGKSAALGIAAAGAIAQGYSNIFCTAPSPENLQTFFEFAVKGLKEMGYAEKVDFEALQSTNEDFDKCVIRINVFRAHRQTIQFVSATDVNKFAQAELAIIDEAAALPLPLVRQALGPYLVFLSSTVSGYEGTGRSLSMKLVADMRKRVNSGSGDHRSLKELSLQDPIRYGPNDPVERWLNKLLCLDTTVAPLEISPHPKTCELYYVNRDALFSYHPLAEELLQRIQSLLIAAHYKNQPNDLQLLSDAPGHHLFILCAGTITDNKIPDIFCVIHACEEGQIKAGTIKNNMSLGLRPSGDLIPYSLAQYYLEDEFAKLAGVRVVRIATNPALQRAGYGSRALDLLHKYYSGNISLTAAEKKKATDTEGQTPRGLEDGQEDEEMIKPRKTISNLLSPLVERPFEPLDYIGVSFGLTTELFNFWRRAGYEVMYIRQAVHELTGEHSCVMVKPIDIELGILRREFHHRWLSLLASAFRNLPSDLAMSVTVNTDMHDASKMTQLTDLSERDSGVVRVAGVTQADFEAISRLFSSSDLRRLQLYTTSFVEGGNVLDLLPKVAQLYFAHQLYVAPDGTAGVVLSHAQAAVLLAVGLQCVTVDQLGQQSAFKGVTPQQLRTFLHKAVSRISQHLTYLASITGKAEGKEEKGELIQERRDDSGNVVGLTVGRKEKVTVNTNTNLLHSASKAVIDGTEGASSSHKTKEHFPSKKGSKRRRQ